jgi:hypothetical protein
MANDRVCQQNGELESVGHNRRSAYTDRHIAALNAQTIKASSSADFTRIYSGEVRKFLPPQKTGIYGNADPE